MNQKVRNVIITIIAEALMMLAGFLLPKYILSKLGSELNGYMSTVSTIFGYVILVEGGLGTACLNALYKPVTEKNNEQTSHILKSCERKYRIIALLFFLISTAISFIYPLCLKTEINYWTLFFIVFIEGIAGAISLLTVSAIKQLLIADGKHYIEMLIHSIFYVAGIGTKIGVLYLKADPVLMQLGYFVIQLIEFSLFRIYFHYRYKNLRVIKTESNFKFSEQKYFFIHQVSNAIFSSTDLILISILCSLEASSVYAIYGLVFLSITKILNSLFSALKYLLGNKFYSDRESFAKYKTDFETLFNCLVFIIFTTAILLCNPFVSLYTKGSDIAYVDKTLSYLFLAGQLLSSIRIVSNTVINMAGYANKNIWATITESVLNLGVSISLCLWLGIYGILIGTIVALAFRSTQIFIFESKNVTNKTSLFKTLKAIFVYSLIMIGIIFLNEFVLKLNFDSYGMFILYGFICVIANGLIFGLATLAFDFSLVKSILKKVFKRKRNLYE